MNADMQRTSALRRMVDEHLDIPLSKWIDEQRAGGFTVEEAWMHLRMDTGIPISLRTLYVWLKNDESETSNRKAAS